MSRDDAYSIYKGMETTGILREIFERIGNLEKAVGDLQNRVKAMEHKARPIEVSNGSIKNISDLKAAIGITTGPGPSYYSPPEKPKQEPHPATQTSFVLKI